MHALRRKITRQKEEIRRKDEELLNKMRQKEELEVWYKTWMEQLKYSKYTRVSPVVLEMKNWCATVVFIDLLERYADKVYLIVFTVPHSLWWVRFPLQRGEGASMKRKMSRHDFKHDDEYLKKVPKTNFYKVINHWYHSCQNKLGK